MDAITVSARSFYGEPPIKRSRSHDRESPLPLKNLGNTCYENSIVQCLFGLDIFMSNFERSIERVRQYHLKTKVSTEKPASVTNDTKKTETESNNQLNYESNEIPSSNNSTELNITHKNGTEEGILEKAENEPKKSSEQQQHAQPLVDTAQEQKPEQHQPLSQQVIKSDTEDNVRYKIADAFDKLYKAYTSNPIEQSIIESRLEDLKSAVGERSSQFNSTHQQDASEFFYHVIDSIQEFYDSLDKTEEDDNPVTKAFELELDHLIRCPKCHHRIISGPEKIRTLPLATEAQPDYTLRDALHNYFKDDLLDYNCSQPSCDSKQRTKKCLIRKLPQILFITLARYSYTGKKNLDEIEAPFQLSVPFQENKSPSRPSSPPGQHQNHDENDSRYYLAAVVCHLGSSLNVGHYTSYVYNQNNSSWYSCDDDSISKVEETEVKSDASKSGYCFFYVHSSCIDVLKWKHSDRALSLDGVRTSVAQSSVVMTPESSPESSPPPSDSMIKLSNYKC